MKFFFILVILIFNSHIYASHFDSIELMTEEFPPYNFKDNGKAYGISIEIMSMLLNLDHSKKINRDFIFYPWIRSYTKLKKEKKKVLFVMTKTQDRKNLFKWVGPISESKNVIIGMKSSGIKVNNSADLLKYKICIVSEDAAGQLLLSLLKNKKENLIEVASIDRCLSMLLVNRVDLMAYDLNVTHWLLNKMNRKKDDIKALYPLGKGEHYFAFSKDTSDEFINYTQALLDQLKKSGDIDRIHKKYIEN
jgi:polar amino acid transport system substrate-binding protein